MSDADQAAEAIVGRIRSAAAPAITAADAEVLAAAPNRTPMMEKLLAVHYAQTGREDDALEAARRIFAQERTAENAKNLALLLRRLKRTDEGIAFCRAQEACFDPAEWNDAMAMLHADRGERSEAARHGTRALEIKDAACDPAPASPPRTAPFDPEARGRNVISFSLWGTDRRYLTGALTNAVVARYLYPGWTARFHVDRSVQAEVRAQLTREGAQVVEVPERFPAARFGLFWRFLAEDDPNVDIYLVRDADSVMNIRERAAVEDWLDSGRAFHVMRDLPTHSELILAGMWGAHRGNIGQMGRRVSEYLSADARKVGNRITDQEFLRRRIWPIVRQDVLVHDAWFDFGNPRRFRDEFRIPSAYHVGQNDWVHRRVIPAGGVAQ